MKIHQNFFTLAHKVALGQKHDVIDSSFNRNWGFEDERAITDGISNAALLSKKALKNKRLLSKKALEAVARKKMKMQKKFEKLKSIEDVSDYNKMVKKISKNHKRRKLLLLLLVGRIVVYLDVQRVLKVNIRWLMVC